jgi:hypothetical protein
MNIVWGGILFVVTAIAWLGQVIAAFWPDSAEKLSLTERKSDIDPTFYADVRGEAWWDALILWTLPVAAILLVLDNPLWAVFGLIGGGMYLYFAGRGIVTRRMMRSKNIRIGAPESSKLYTVFLTLWGVAAIITIILAWIAISGSN